MFYKREDSGYMMPVEGVRLKTLVHGEKTHLCEFRINRGSMIPEHGQPPRTDRGLDLRPDKIHS